LAAAGELGERPLRVLHVDHALRDDSAADAAFVADLCAGLGVDCTVERVDVAAEAERDGLNLEDAGRIARYRLAEAEADRLAAGTGVDAALVRIATAHTRDDRVETMLMRLAEGAGPAGLSGVRPVRGRIVRPLIDVRRGALRAWLDEIGQDWRDDESNLDTSRRRAWVRHELMPLFESANPGFVDAVARTVEVVSEEDDLLDEMAHAFARDFELPEGGEDALVLDESLMGTLSGAMARRVLRTAIARRFPEASRIEFEHVRALTDAIGTEGVRRDVTGGLRASVECGRIIISRSGGVRAEVPDAILSIPGEVELGEFGRLSGEYSSETGIPNDSNEARLDADSLTGRLAVGPLRDGDRMRPLGMSGTKLVADLLAEAGVPTARKHAVPVVRDDRGIAWVAGVRLSDEHKVRDETERTVRLVWEPSDGSDGKRAGSE
jgi:tRNA(Ile)-lysidine synthase